MEEHHFLHSPSLESVFFVVTSSLTVERWRYAVRVRPFFWLFLAFVCIGILVYAATVHIIAPAQLHVQLAQRPTPVTPTILKVHVTDEQGLTVDGAKISTQAWMTNMLMAANTISTTSQGQGNFLVHISFSMVGPWMITVTMQADGFLPLHQTLLVQVQPTPAFVCLIAHSLAGNGSERTFCLQQPVMLIRLSPTNVNTS
jgi:hypothetical protein